jgi:SAM-dependent methyltransferase
MAHTEQMNFITSVRDMFSWAFHDRRVLEVGSWNVNGTVRPLFERCSYLGIDLAPGDCVDLVCKGADYRSDQPFDTVLSTECFEHDEQWADTLRNMIRHTKPGGLMIITCASTGRAEHGTRRTSPDASLSSSFSDYYRNLTAQDFEQAVDLRALFSVHEFSNGNAGRDLYFWGIRSAEPVHDQPEWLQQPCEQRSACLVTGYLALNTVYRSHDKYLEYARNLFGCGEPTVAFVDDSIQDPGLPANMKVVPARLQDCWLNRYREGAELPTIRNGNKDTADFFAIQCQKTSWILQACQHSRARMLAWVDFGLMHLPDVQAEDLNDFYDRLLDDPGDKVQIGSIWPLSPESKISLNEPEWYCAGGVIVVPRRLAAWFAGAVEARMAQHVRETGRLTWEVGIWALVAQANPDRVALWSCGHDRRLLTGYTY